MTITHDESLNRLQAAVAGGMGVLRYRIQGDTIWLLHVQIPQVAQGHGVASRLTRAALELVQERALKPSKMVDGRVCFQKSGGRAASRPLPPRPQERGA